MIICWITAIIGIGLIVLGLISAIILWMTEKDFVAGFLIFILLGLMSMVFLAPPLLGRWRDLSYKYEPPTFIMKTNNITVLTYVENGAVRLSGSYDTADFWNSTNIAVKLTAGRNFFNYPLEGHTAEFVAKRGE